jgi:recombination protein RecT
MNALQPGDGRSVTATPAIRKLSPVEVFVGEVISPDKEKDVIDALPAGVDPKRFKHSLTVAVMQNPNLMKIHPGLLFREVSKAASLGLSMDPQLGEAYMVISRNSKANRDEPQLRVGWKGLAKLARQSGEITLIYAHAVHERDITDGHFRVTLGAEPQLIHEPDIFTDRGPVVGYYAVTKYRDGDFDFEPMSVEEIHKIRDKTDAYRAFRAGRIKSTPWADWEQEMARKTVIRRLLKRSPMSAEMQAAVKLIDEEETGVIDDTPPAPQLAPPRRGRPPGSRTAALQEIAAPKAQKNKPQDEPETEEEWAAQGQPQQEAIGMPESILDEEPIADTVDTPDSPEPVIDPTSEDYARGMRDFHAGLKKCVKREILENPEKLSNWQAGWSDARDGADEAMNGRDED